MSRIILNEADRDTLRRQAAQGDAYSKDNQSKGRNRLARSTYSSFGNSVKEYNNIDMNTFFKYDILTVSIIINGETDTYTVTIKMGGILDKLKPLLSNGDPVDLRVVTKAVIGAFNDSSTDIYLHCSCPDWKYRMDYWATQNDINSGNPQNVPSDETNPDDTKGPGCKHSLACLNRNSWLMKVVSVITNYIKYMEKNRPELYQSVIYPAIYGKKYSESDIEQDIDIDTEDTEVEEPTEDEEDLPTDVGTIDTSNKYAKIKNLKQYRDKPKEVQNDDIDNTI